MRHVDRRQDDDDELALALESRDDFGRDRGSAGGLEGMKMGLVTGTSPRGVGSPQSDEPPPFMSPGRDRACAGGATATTSGTF